MEEISSNEQEIQNRATVKALYKSLESGDTKIISRLLAPDLEWWFHGPQNCHHMIRMLMGEAPHTEFIFEPRSVATIDDQIVIFEGYEGANVYWVHVWALKDGLFTRFREYFNTWLTVKEQSGGHLIGPGRRIVTLCGGANHEIFSAGRCPGSCLPFDGGVILGQTYCVKLCQEHNAIVVK